MSSEPGINTVNVELMLERENSVKSVSDNRNSDAVSCMIELLGYSLHLTKHMTVLMVSPTS